ncbi:MAG: PleD family two-component system response regulator [Candidatus Levyibacteriota bacterium]
MEDKKKILIVDDDTDFDTKLAEKIKGAGMEPIITLSGKEALEYLAVNNVDLIILDFVMPEMDGYAFYHTLKHDMRKNIPTVVLTNLSSIENAEGLAVYTKSETNLDDFVKEVSASLNKGEKPV